MLNLTDTFSESYSNKIVFISFFGRTKYSVFTLSKEMWVQKGGNKCRDYGKRKEAETRQRKEFVNQRFLYSKKSSTGESQ